VLVLAALMVATFVLSLALARSLFPLYSINHDDAMYVYEAKVLGDGRLTLPAAEHDLFRPWASGVRDGQVVMKYTPPWPAVLAAGQWALGSMRVAAAGVAAAAVGLVYLLAREVAPGRRAALMAAGVFAFSPVTLFQGGTFLPYLFGLVSGLGFAVGLLAGVRRRSAVLLVASGASFGVGFFARPFDAVLFALPFVAVLAWRLRHEPASLGRTAGWVAAGAVPVLALDLAYNARTMGSPLALPFTVTGPNDTVGFGERGVFADRTFDFGPRDGLRALGENLRWLPRWSFGGIAVLGLAGFALVAAARSGWRRTPWAWALAGLAAAVCVGYVFFWSPFSMSLRWPGVQTLGPFYHLAVLVPVAILGAWGFDLLWQRAGAARRIGVAAVLAGVALTAVDLPAKVDANADVRDSYRQVEDQVDALGLTSAVLVVPQRGRDGFLSPVPFLENEPDLDQPVLYAEDREERNFELFDRFPDRSIYQLVQQHEPGDVFLEPSLVPTRLRLERGEGLLLHFQVTNVTDQTHMVAYISDGRSRKVRLLAGDSSWGDRYDVSWHLEPGAAAATPEDEETFTPAATEAAMLTVGLTADDPTTARDDVRWERRIPYRTVGDEVQLIQPGLGYELLAAGGERHWIARNVDDRLAEAPAVDAR
jgi:4-amino-4-deoxy-L-arabinose transferase-like glycosyltransferase